MAKAYWVLGKRVHMVTALQRQHMKSAGLLVAALSLFLLKPVSCIRQYDDFTGALDMGSESRGVDGKSGDAQGGDVTLDTVPTDALQPKDTVDTLAPVDTLDIVEPNDLLDTVEPKDPVDTIEPVDTFDVKDACVPDCDGKQCGGDGCGGSCGECDGNTLCDAGACVSSCGNGSCDDAIGEDCSTCPEDCGCDPDIEECTETTGLGWVCAVKMVEIPAGTFWMGCNNCDGSSVNDDDCLAREHPYHKVFLDVYRMDRTEVTADQYAACVSADACTPPGTAQYSTWQEPGKGSHPINYVTWDQATDFCEWTNKRLCTEAEWEKGARGGCELNDGPVSCKAQSRRFPWGAEDPTCELAAMNGCPDDSLPVCSFSPDSDSPYGLCDMAGNVNEWVEDLYQADYYCDGFAATGDEACLPCSDWPGAPAEWSNPTGPESGLWRVKRGGSFGDGGAVLRVSSRYYSTQGFIGGGLGIRCCDSDCGDGVCNDAIGEDCSTCLQDCGCEPGDVCADGDCVPVIGAFVPIEAETFWMGSPAGGGEQCPVGYTGGGCDGSGSGTTVTEPGRIEAREALHEVELTYGFDVQLHETTQGQWEMAFGGWNPSTVSSGDDYPVDTVSWYDACAYANWVSSQEGLSACYQFSDVHCQQGGDPTDGTDWFACMDAAHGGIDEALVTLTGGATEPQECPGYRLPTDAEWEYAARAGTLSAYPNGEASDAGHLECEVPFHLTGIAWYCGNNDPSGTKAVAGKAPNAWGLFDMSGNLYEWCWDAFCEDAMQLGVDPHGEGCPEIARVVRGGYWANDAQYCRSANRGMGPPGQGTANVGFRLVRSVGVDCTPECVGKECGDDGCGGTCGDCPADYPNCVAGICKCTPFSCGAGTYCIGGLCKPCTVNAHCGPDCVSCSALGQFCAAGGTHCIECDAAHVCPPGEKCEEEVCVDCAALGLCGPDCLECGGSTPICVDGGCACSEESCPTQHVCEESACVPCTQVDPAHCGPSCLVCSGATPHCNAGVCDLCVLGEACGPACQPCGGAVPYCAETIESCVACLLDDHCQALESCVDGLCVPPCSAEGCSGDLTSAGTTCETSIIIGRTAADATAGGFSYTGDTTDDGDDDNLPSFGVNCWDAQADNFFRIWLNAGDQVIVIADPQESDYQLSLKVYAGTTCGSTNNLIACAWDEDDGVPESFIHTASQDGWITIVVDGASGFDDQYDWGHYDLTVTLMCAEGDCCCP